MIVLGIETSCDETACAIVQELAISLDKEVGGDVAASLAELYVYIHKRLGDANIEQSDVPLAEAEKLLNTLLEAWSQLEETQEEEHHGESLALSA